MQTLQELKNMLASLEAMEQNLRKLIVQMECEAAGSGEEIRDFEEVYPLSVSPAFFKGKRPASIMFPDGRRLATPTWKKFVAALMEDCNKDKTRHDKLMLMRNWVQGRERTLLGKSIEKMRSPIMIDEGLYLETHYDTESLLRITTDRILKAVGYDYSSIKVVIRKENQ